MKHTPRDGHTSDGRKNFLRRFDALSPALLQWLVFLLSFFIYFLTADRYASYWDCPEYIVTASLLEVGHPPGNPFWSLAMRVATIPFPPELHPFVINLCSGFLTAFAAFFLFKVIFLLTTLCGRRRDRVGRPASLAAFCGSLSFAFCDSVWFSAVEAEVYAMSAFFTAITIWLALRCSLTPDPNRRFRLICLLAYICGLALGVHQLNLLCIPVFLLIFLYGSDRRRIPPFRVLAVILAGCIAVAIILYAATIGLPRFAAATELFAVNTLGLPFNSGLFIFGSIIIIFLTVWCVTAWRNYRLHRRALSSIPWAAAFLLIGYSSFSLIMIRAAASPPMNEGSPSDIFSFASYMARDQYPSAPLIYGATPFSAPVYIESYRHGDTIPTYRRYLLEARKPRYVRAETGAKPRLHPRSGLLLHEDSLANMQILTGNRPSYILSDYDFRQVTTPELNMWFPRITKMPPGGIADLEAWTGMTEENMAHVAVSDAVDTLGFFTTRKGIDGSRTHVTSLRPTYLQNLCFFVSYQVYHMYLRYLLWNFVGRDDELPAIGLFDAPAAVKNDPARNIYYGLPFLVGLIGMVFLLCAGRTGRRVFSVILLFFLLTGVAIVVYLNQSVGEPRERDYSFLGSYMAFSIWIGFGIYAIGTFLSRLSRGKRRLAFLLTLLPAIGIPALMVVENFDDHDRRGRGEPAAYASYILDRKCPSIIFSYGDNDTFPLWFTQEVLGKGPQHTVVDISYLGMPDYVANLMKQGDKGLQLTATPDDILYGAYAFTHLPPRNGDTIPVPLIDALRELYSHTSSQPRFSHSLVLLPLPTFDGRYSNDHSSVVLDLYDLASSSGSIPFKTLMLLDIIATNAASPSPRALFFLFSAPSSFTHGLDSLLLPAPLGHFLLPPHTTSNPSDNSDNSDRLLIDALLPISSDTIDYSRRNHYTDPLLRRRHTLIKR